MTPKQLKQKPFEELFKNQHEKVDTDKGESIEEEEKSTTSSDKSGQNSESETHEVHNFLNETIHDEENSSEAEDDTPEEQNLNEMQAYENNGSKTNKKRNS